MPRKVLEAIEKREGRSMDQILIALYAEHGKQKEVAKVLKVGPATISQWLTRLGLQEKTILVPRPSRKSAHQYPTQPVEE